MDFRPHPDANLLSAFLEGSAEGVLDRAGRRALLRHLSACDACRQVAAAANTLCRPSPSLRLHPLAPRPSLTARLAPLAAAATVVLAAGLWVLAPRPVPLAKPAAPPLIHHLAPLAAAAPPARVPAARHPTARLAPHPDVLAASAGPMPTLPAVPVPPPSGEIRPSIDFSPLMTGFQDQAPAIPYSSQLATWIEPASNPSQPSTPTSTASAATEAAPAPIASSSFGENFVSSSPVSAADLSGPLAPLLASGASGLGWTLSRGGQLLRSIGAGMWAAVPLVPGVHLRALAASDSRVWAAGRADQLYVSQDRGAHWKQVRLPGAGSHPAPVQSIVFTDALHGAITADNGQAWRTSNGGASWTKK